MTNRLELHLLVSWGQIGIILLRPGIANLNFSEGGGILFERVK